jgi:hypothetical protein
VQAASSSTGVWESFLETSFFKAFKMIPSLKEQRSIKTKKPSKKFETVLQNFFYLLFTFYFKIFTFSQISFLFQI